MVLFRCAETGSSVVAKMWDHSTVDPPHVTGMCVWFMSHLSELQGVHSTC